MHILIDSREKIPLNFSFWSDVDTSTICLKFGDYSLLGLQGRVFVERKASSGELYGNLVKNYKRFKKELERAKDCHYKYIICEFLQEDILNFPKNSGIPIFLQKKLRFKGNFFNNRILKIEENYDIKFIFCGSAEKASEMVIEIFKTIENNEKIR